MYCFFYDQWFGHDRVKFCTWIQAKAWDFFEVVWYWYVLCLWKEVSREEQYEGELDLSKHEKIKLIPTLMSKKTLEFVHWFVRHRFCTYRKAIPLWIGDPEEVVKRERKKKSSQEQKLVVFSDSWSLYNYQKKYRFPSHAKVMHSKRTKKQKAELFREVKNGESSYVLCTFSHMFQDWKNLKEIVVVNEHMWYYKSQQDPRYNAAIVAKEMAKIYWAKITTTGYSLDVSSGKK